jgi:threonine dehydrogenase-like Zn-dependent dehydrogenase
VGTSVTSAWPTASTCPARSCSSATSTCTAARRAGSLPQLIDLIWNRQIDPGKVFDLELPLERAAAGYQAMDQRQAIKVLLHP